MTTNKTTFTYTPILGGYQEGVTRRDPSPVIRVENTYHVWYSRTTLCSSGYPASVWHATSADGHDWTEQEEAIPKGPAGAFDEHGVFTPTVLITADRLYLIYTAVPEPFTNDNGGPNGTRTAIGMAEADSPHGPWIKFAGNPILEPSTDPTRFDSYRTDDACFLVRGGKYWLYYKGRPDGKTPGDTQTGLAIADVPTGPYVKHPASPVIGSGHEVCVFPKDNGVMAIVSPTGPDGRTLQYSEDGLSFEIVERDVDPPGAPGPFREDHFRDGAGPGIAWGICQNVSDRPNWPFLMRFDGVPPLR